MRNLITLCPKCHDVAELNSMSKKDIINYKRDGFTTIEKLTTTSDDWRKWVYGGYTKED